MRRAWIGIIGIILIVVILVGGAGYLLYSGGKPEVPEVKSITNSWGDITTESSEIKTDIQVDNSNAFPIPIKGMEYQIFMNDVKMGSGHSMGKASLPAQKEHTITMSTEVENDKIPEWWVTHIRQWENTDIKIKGNIALDLKVTEYEYPIEREISRVKTDILGVKKSYSVDEESLKPQLRSIENSWGEVTDDFTVILMKVVVYNPQRVPIYIEQIRYKMDMNEIKMGLGTSEESILLKPQSDTEIRLDTKLDNHKLDNWWVTHLKNGEKTEVKIESELVYTVGENEFTMELPVQEKSIETDILGK